MSLVRLPCFFNRVQRIERYSTTSSKKIKKWIIVHLFNEEEEEEEEPYLQCMFNLCMTIVRLPVPFNY